MIHIADVYVVGAFQQTSILACKRTYAVQCSAVQCSAVQCSAVQCSAVQCSAVQCSAVPCSTVQYSSVQSSAVQCSAVSYTAVQFSAVQVQGSIEQGWAQAGQWRQCDLQYRTRSATSAHSCSKCSPDASPYVGSFHMSMERKQNQL